VRSFAGSSHVFTNSDAGSLARLASAAADIALIIDKSGTIRELAGDNPNLPLDQWSDWIGRSWSEVVSVESRPKVESMQRDASAGVITRWRHLNHPGRDGGESVPVMYRVVPLGSDGSMVAVGRDLQEMAELQRRLLEVQQTVDREEKQRRQAEARQRILFQSSVDPLLVVDSLTGRVFESNPAADIMLPVVTRRRGPGTWDDGLDPQGADAMRALLARVRSSGRPDQAQVHGLDGTALLVNATPFREDGFALAMVRIAPVVGYAAGSNRGPAGPDQKPSLSSVAEYSPEAIVRTDLNGQILSANGAFINMVRVSAESSIAGQSLDRWLDGAGVDLRVLMANARQHGVMRRFSTVLRDEHGHQVDIELAAVNLPDEDPPGFGFLIREAARWHAAGPETADDPSQVAGRSVDQLTELVGRVPLKELVREAADVIERLAIEAALKLTGDNRALASDLLGLSRQSLYIKLHRYGLGDLTPEPSVKDQGDPPGAKPASARKTAAKPTGRAAAKAAAVSNRAAAKSATKAPLKRRG
jgi:transcriptional regulator PpsR